MLLITNNYVKDWRVGMHLLKKKELLTADQQKLLQLKSELRNCERLLKQTEMLFHMTVDEDLIEARIYELKSLSKVQSHLINSIKQLMATQAVETNPESVNV